MRRFSNSLATFSLCVGTLALGACGGHGPNTYLMPKEAVAAKLDGASREYAFGGKDKRTISAVRRSGDTIKVRVKYNTGSLGTSMCEAQVEAIDEDWTRVTPVCPKSSDAAENLQAEINEMQVDEFVLAVLYDREVDSSMVLKRTSAVAIDNIGKIANQTIEEDLAEYQGPTSSEPVAGDWGSEGGSDWGN